MNFGMNEMGFGLAGAVLMVLLQGALPMAKKLLAQGAPRVDTPGSPGEPWWLSFLRDALRQVSEGYHVTITVKPREENEAR